MINVCLSHNIIQQQIFIILESIKIIYFEQSGIKADNISIMNTYFIINCTKNRYILFYILIINFLYFNNKNIRKVSLSIIV